MRNVAEVYYIANAITNRLVVLGKFALMRFSVLLTSRLKSALGFVSNRLEANACVDITNAGFQLPDAFLICPNFIEHRLLSIQHGIKIIQGGDTNSLYPSKNPSLLLQVNYSTFLPSVLIPIEAVLLPQIKIGVDDIHDRRRLRFFCCQRSKLLGNVL